MKDKIEPEYYTNMPIAPSDYIFANNIPYFEGNVIKYISRHRFKNGAEDVLKAIKYCEMILDKVYNIKIEINYPSSLRKNNEKSG